MDGRVGWLSGPSCIYQPTTDLGAKKMEGSRKCEMKEENEKDGQFPLLMG